MLRSCYGHPACCTGLGKTYRTTANHTFLHAAEKHALKDRACSCQYCLVKLKVLSVNSDGEVCEGGVQGGCELTVHQQRTARTAEGGLAPDAEHLICKSVLVDA